MKPDQEIQEEAARLERLARRWISTIETMPASTTLMVLPEPRISDATRTHRRLLRVEVAHESETPEFLLVQDESDYGRAASRSDSLVLTRSDSAYDVLRDGYEVLEEDRLAESLTPIVDRIEREESIEDADPELVEEIESIVETDHLAPSARLRTRADIVEFLEGRLSPGEFISAAIERQGRRPQQREFVAELLSERISIT